MPDLNVGQTIGKIGDDVRICKRQSGTHPAVLRSDKGKTFFLPDTLTKGVSGQFNENRLPHHVEISTLDSSAVKAEFLERQFQMLDILDNMSSDAYAELLQDIIQIDGAGAYVDINVRNFLMDPEHDRFGLIDLEEKLEEHEAEGENPLNLFTVLAYEKITYRKDSLGLSDIENDTLIKREQAVLAGVLDKLLTALERTPSDLWGFEEAPDEADLNFAGFTDTQKISALHRIEALKVSQANISPRPFEICKQIDNIFI